MNFLVWILLGLIAGWLASIIMKTDHQQGPMMDIIFGIIGAFVGGFVFNMLGMAGTTGLNFYSILVATVGAMITIWIERRITNR